jgi:chemotaxis response regulator CheB
LTATFPITVAIGVHVISSFESSIVEFVAQACQRQVDLVHEDGRPEVDVEPP